MTIDKCQMIMGRYLTIMLAIKNLLTPRRGAQLLVILLCASGLKLYYSTASPNDLRWILAPTTFLNRTASPPVG